MTARSDGSSRWVDEANGLEAEHEALSDDAIRAQFAEIREEIRELAAAEGEPSDDELTHPDRERRRELRKRPPQARERGAPATRSTRSSPKSSR